MCLYTKQRKLKKADRDIYAYKVVICVGGYYHTPFYVTPISKHAINGETPFKAEGNIRKERGIHRGETKITCRLIHVFGSAECAIEVAKCFMEAYCWHCEVYEVKIPKGTLYYDGFTISSSAAKASKKIQFVKRLDS